MPQLRSLPEMQAIIESHRHWSDIKEETEAWISAQLSDPIDEIINEKHLVQPSPEAGTTVQVVHYTSLDAVVNILNAAAQAGDGSEPPAGYLRLYGSSRSNDPQEGRYLIKEHPDLKALLVPAQTPFAYLASFVMLDNAGQIDDVADNMQLWRTYGHNGHGCSLTLTVLADKLRKVQYGPEAAQRTCRVLQQSLASIDCAIATMETDNRYAAKDMKKCRDEKLTSQLRKIQYLYKSRYYSYEN